jgi:uncharacterized protein (DUF1919 family)
MKLGFYSRFVKHKINVAADKRYIKKTRNTIRNKDFTIISNNCWGGGVYEDLGLSYTTPTVGLFFFAPCYIKFISNLHSNLQASLQFIQESRYEKGNALLRQNKYPVGLINNDIEIHFLHYHSEAEALEKWTRRASRVNFDNLFLSFTDNEICTMDEIRSFDKLPYRKIFFSAKRIDGIKSLIHLRMFDGQPGVGNLYDNRWTYRKYFDVVKWLNTKSPY